MTENFRKGDRVDWHTSRITTEPDISKRSSDDRGDRVGAEDDHASPIEQR